MLWFRRGCVSSAQQERRNKYNSKGVICKLTVRYAINLCSSNIKLSSPCKISLLRHSWAWTRPASVSTWSQEQHYRHFVCDVLWTVYPALDLLTNLVQDKLRCIPNHRRSRLIHSLSRSCVLTEHPWEIMLAHQVRGRHDDLHKSCSLSIELLP
jgi:hypothetical protein